MQFYEGRDFDIGPGAPHYLLRPEAVESFFVLNQLTGDPIYREWGWEVFSAIERYCKTEIAYGQLRDVQNTNPYPDDKMESFFLAETLKYLYLLMDPDTEVDVLNKVSYWAVTRRGLDHLSESNLTTFFQHVFNTEAHPTRIFPVQDQAKIAQT